MGSPILLSYPPGGSGGGTAFDPATTVFLYDDFTTIQGGSGPNVVQSELFWLASGNGIIDRDFTMPGAVGSLGVHSVASGQEALFSTDASGTKFLVALNDKTFDLKIRFQYDSINDSIVYQMGFQDGASPQFFNNSIALHYDVSVSANFRFYCLSAGTATIVDSGIPADINPHTVRIRALVAGTILFSLDGGTETSISTNVPTVPMNIVAVAVGTFGTTTTDHTCFLDYVYFTITGLTR